MHPWPRKSSRTAYETQLFSLISQAILVLTVVTALSFGPVCGWAGENVGKRIFTVKDLIEISYIVNPARWTNIGTRGEQPLGVPIYSPDGKYFLLVTQRGVFVTNALESTIWLFDVQGVRDYTAGKSATKPAPRKLVIMNSVSNTPIINDVRWTDDSKKIAFLGKDNSPYQRLFIADLGTGAVRAVTKEDLYVTAFDMHNDTIAYTVLAREQPSGGLESSLIDVDKKTIRELLYRTPPSTEDLGESLLSRLPSSLHLLKAGQEIPFAFTMQGSPLRLFVPTLSLSPDAHFLITIAPVYEIPTLWEQYQPFTEQFRVKAGPVLNRTAMSPESFWRPEQYVIVDLETGSVSPLVDAPAGRGMGYRAPSEAWWFQDNRHSILTNTFLPFDAPRDHTNSAQRRARSMVATVDVSTREVQEITDLRLPNSNETVNWYGMDDIVWNATKQELTLRYKSIIEAPIADPPAPERYALSSGGWVRIPDANQPLDNRPGNGVGMLVRQDLNNPPMLWAQVSGTESESVLWDPNPQIEHLKLGKASIYRWRDAKGRDWSGILALPPDYDPRRRYPLVIQTHGYDAQKFFADGYASTGNGGMALVAKGIIVLQMDMSVMHLSTPEEGPDQEAGFESAINHLATDGLVDANLVGAIGFSRTCFHVLYALTHRPNLFRAASITDGVNFGYVDYILQRAGNEYQKEAESIHKGAPFGDDLVKWIRNAPNFNLDKVQAPLLISAFEKGTLLSEWETYAGLQRLNKPVDMLWWWQENTPHILVQPAQRYASQQSAVDWFDFWLNGHEDPDSTKTEQYRRWRTLRRLHEDNHHRAGLSSK